jgi:SAM-dependent methyltransferase
MDRTVFDRMAEHDERHWWYVARREVLSDLIERRIRLPENPRILEIGCGTGHNFGMLGRFGQVDATEVDAPAREVATQRLGREIGAAPLPELTGVPDGAYDLIALLDVLEHVSDDEGALRSIRSKLAPGGRILVTVPAYQWMWSAHDEIHHHHRRYSRASLRRVAGAAGCRVEMITHFNSLLFPLAAAARIAGKIVGKKGSDDRMPPAPLNAAFRAVFSAERHLVGRVPLPAGISLAAILA